MTLMMKNDEWQELLSRVCTSGVKQAGEIVQREVSAREVEDMTPEQEQVLLNRVTGATIAGMLNAALTVAQGVGMSPEAIQRLLDEVLHSRGIHVRPSNRPAPERLN